ncbi:MAG: hypothetical protein D6813_09220 [Calditrichaeota bacterium]|nr:MAG: hypothetical protein D6813_09220 [Calditrichota bacterium]
MYLKMGRKILKQLFVIFLFFLLPSTTNSQTKSWEQILINEAKRKDGHYFVSLNKISEVLNLNTYYSNKARKVLLYIGDDKITVTAFSPFIVADQTVIQLPIETRYRDGDIFVPIHFFLPILKSYMDTNDNFSDANDLKFLTHRANILGIRSEKKANGTLIRILTTQAFDKSNISTRYSRRWFYVDILYGKINKENITIKNKSDLIREIVPIQLEQMVQLSFRLKKDISSSNIEVTLQPNEIWIAIPESQPSPDLIKKLKTDKEKWRIDKIVIDPGHGGRDPGAIGPHGTREKDVVLAICKKLKRLIEKNLDIEVIMTRESDVFVPLKERTQLANKKGGKLFISVHANSNRSSRVGGVTTYFLGPARSEEALEVAQRENAVIQYEADTGAYSKLGDEAFILAAMAQNDYMRESQDLAAMIQREFKNQLKIKNRGVKQAGYYVLVGASMPNVLIETAFISNKKEEKLLRSSRFQQKVAEAIFKSIKKFKQKYEWDL